MIADLNGPLEVIKRLRADFGEGWEEQADFMLANMVEGYITDDKLNPEQAAAKLLRVLTDKDGTVVVSKAQIRRAVAQGYRDYRDVRSPGEGDKVRVVT